LTTITGKNLFLLSLGIIPTNTDYRLKITGFETEVTPENLTQRFGSHNYYVDPKHDRVGYVVKIKTMKYAKQLMSKWHNKVIVGQKIKCQLELNPIPVARRNRSRSRGPLTEGELKHQRPRTQPQDAQSVQSVQSSQETSVFGDTDNTMTMQFDNREADRDRRICGKALNDITRSRSKSNMRHASSSESITSLVDPKCEYLFLRN
jgi:hypothetical protein